MARHGKFYFQKENSPFKDYSEETIYELTEAYNTNKPLKEVIHEMDLQGVTPHQFYLNLPHILSDEKCAKCEEPIYIKQAGRYENDQRRLCINCHHNYTKDCNCSYCETERKETFERNKADYEQQAHQWLKQQNTMIYQPSEVSLMEEIWLVLIYNHYATNKGLLDFTQAQFYNNYRFKKMPYEYQIFVYDLIEKKLLLPTGYPEYSPSYCRKNERGKYDFSLLYNESIWRINIDFPVNQETYIRQIKDKKYTAEEMSILWKQIYRSELLLYLENQNQTYFDYVLDLNLLDVHLDDLIEHYSLAKAYALIYFTTTSCLKYIHKYRPTEKALRTRFLNLLEQYIEKNIDNPNLRDFDRLPVDLNDASTYIVENILKQKKHYFYLKTKDVLQFKTI